MAVKRIVAVVSIKFTTPAGIARKQGEFYLKGRTPEKVAAEWWQEIQREMFTGELVEVITDGEDITALLLME